MTTSSNTLVKNRKKHLIEPTMGGMSLKEIAQLIGVSPSYLSQVRHGVRPISDEIKQKLIKNGIEIKQIIKQKRKKRKVVTTTGGSAWESNPPKTLQTPPNGVEVREAHRDSSAPEF